MNSAPDWVPLATLMGAVFSIVALFGLGLTVAILGRMRPSPRRFMLLVTAAGVTGVVLTIISVNSVAWVTDRFDPAVLWAEHLQLIVFIPASTLTVMGALHYRWYKVQDEQQADHPVESS